MKIVKIVGIILLSLLLLVAMVGYFYFKSTVPAWDGVLTGSGVAQPVAIERNAHGVPAIKAGESADLFFAIGFVHAQDRLFQMDCQRRAATGRLSEIFGSRTLERDIWQKYLQAEAGIEKSFRALKPQPRKLLEQYCRGVNYFISSQSLPPEFHILNYAPEPWQPRDVMAAMKYLESEMTRSGGELNHARLLSALSPGKVDRWLAAPRPDFENGLAFWPRVFATPLPGRLLRADTEASQREAAGSAWAIAGRRTSSGLPLLANDFSWHPVIPSLFYQVSGKTPLWEISGNTLPGVPFIFSGRNWQMGWGIEASASDTLDYFVLEPHPDNPALYRCDGRWLSLQFREKRIRCRGRQDLVLKLPFSKFGPVIKADGSLLAVHSLVHLRSSAVQALYRMNSARNAREFTAALRTFSAPALRVVFADRKGNIGACQAGLLPVRGRGNGLLPLRARFSSDLWQGFSEAGGGRGIYNPGRGWLSGADLTRSGGTAPVFFKFQPVPDFLGQRLEQLLASRDRIDSQAAARLQNDTRVQNAGFLVDLIRDLPLVSAGARQVRNILSAWDLDASEGEGPALFYEFEKRLATAIFAPSFSDPAAVAGIDPRWIYPLLKYPSRLGKEMTKPLLSELGGGLVDARSLAVAVEKSLEETHGAYRGQTLDQNDRWHWENLHHVNFTHPLGAVFVLKPFFEGGATPIKGGRYCLSNSDFAPGGSFRIGRLAAYKMIIDLGSFSRSLLAYPTGQSGHPLSPAYDDQAEMFTGLKYLNMEAPGRRSYRLRLLPAADPKPRARIPVRGESRAVRRG